MLISVVLATYNEEINLGKCLESIKDIASEIIIVDGGSQDRTRDIAHKYGAKVVETDNPKIFHINKQKAINLASTEWILQLDADEKVSPELKVEITNTISHKPRENGFWIPRKNFFLGKFLSKGGQYPDYTLRLYRRGKGRLPCKSVHEQAVVEGETGYLLQSLLHYPYHSFSDYLRKWNKYTELLSDELETKAKRQPVSTLSNMFILPFLTFASLYIRHKGFVDGFPGFVFALFSSLRHPVAYIKFWEKKYANSH